MKIILEVEIGVVGRFKNADWVERFSIANKPGFFECPDDVIVTQGAVNVEQIMS